MGRMHAQARDGATPLEQHFGVARSAPSAPAPGQPSMPRVPSLAPYNSGKHPCHQIQCLSPPTTFSRRYVATAC